MNSTGKDLSTATRLAIIVALLALTLQGAAAAFAQEWEEDRSGPALATPTPGPDAEYAGFGTFRYVTLTGLLTGVLQSNTNLDEAAVGDVALQLYHLPPDQPLEWQELAATKSAEDGFYNLIPSDRELLDTLLSDVEVVNLAIVGHKVHEGNMLLTENFFSLRRTADLLHLEVTDEPQMKLSEFELSAGCPLPLPLCPAEVQAAADDGTQGEGSQHIEGGNNICQERDARGHCILAYNYYNGCLIEYSKQRQENVRTIVGELHSDPGAESEFEYSRGNISSSVLEMKASKSGGGFESAGTKTLKSKGSVSWPVISNSDTWGKPALTNIEHWEIRRRVSCGEGYADRFFHEAIEWQAGATWDDWTDWSWVNSYSYALSAADNGRASAHDFGSTFHRFSNKAKVFQTAGKAFGVGFAAVSGYDNSVTIRQHFPTSGNESAIKNGGCMIVFGLDGGPLTSGVVHVYKSKSICGHPQV